VVRIAPVGMRGGHFRLALAVAMLLFALGAALLTRDGGSQSVRASVGNAPAGTFVSGSQSGRELASRVQSARPGLVGPLRNLKPTKPVWHGNKNVEARELTYPLRAAPGESHDGALQSSMPSTQVPGPPTAFEGVNNINGVYPPDTNGDVGPNHYMQWVNESYAIYNKTTGALVLGPLAGNTLFSDASRTPHCAATNDGDPVVLYDQHAGRWLASQFNGANYICIAISTTSDPTG